MTPTTHVPATHAPATHVPATHAPATCTPVTYAIVALPRDRVLVAMSPAGVCALLLGDTDEVLEQNLRDRFGRTCTLTRLTDCPDTILDIARLVETPARPVRVPLDLRGTDFQKTVWAALQTIPAGETRTYGEIAALIGRPRSARAVGQACGANPVSIIVPCHRVVGAGGHPGGYGWGLERKRRLLDLEREASGRPR